MNWLPLIGVVVFLLTVAVWRPWVQRRRFGTSGVLFLRHGDWRQRARDSAGLALAALLLGHAIVAVRRPEIAAPNLGLALSGAVLLFGGIGLIAASQLNLGASWRIGIDESAKPGLITGGLYAHVRNPIYVAFLVCFTGYALLLPTRLSFVLLAGAFIGIRSQVLREEEYLAPTYGEAWRAYAARVGRFMPGVGKLG